MLRRQLKRDQANNDDEIVPTDSTASNASNRNDDLTALPIFFLVDNFEYNGVVAFHR